MKTTLELYQHAIRLGLRLEPRGDKLAVIPAKRCPAAFATSLRQHKRELLRLLAEAKATGIAPDCTPWLYIARQVLAGEFVGADRSTIESISIGLRRVAHPLCRRALEHLNRKS